MKSADVSVLLPAHGNAIFLQETLESINNSTITPKIVFLINDRLNENILNKLDPHQYNFILKIVKCSGAGLVDALNTAIPQIKTEYIARIDSDDLMAPERLQKQIDYMANNLKVVAVGSQLKFIDDHGNHLGHSDYHNGRVDDNAKFPKACLVAHPSMLMRSRELIQCGSYRKITFQGETNFAEDFDLWLRLSKLGEIHNLSTELTYYRKHSGQVSVIYEAQQELATIYIASLHNIKTELDDDPLVFQYSRVVNLAAVIQKIKTGSGFSGLLLFLAIYFKSLIPEKRKILHFFTSFIVKLFRLLYFA